MKLTQIETIIKGLIENPTKQFDARDYQSGKYFVGYEATARISDVIKMYPILVLVGKVGRFRTIQLNSEDKDNIEYFTKLFEL